jgi:predicted ATPase
MNESITEGSILLWDEPEANLNPEYLPILVECLLELSRHGVQTFVSTHNYLFAKYFDVRRKDGDVVAYHSLYKDEEDLVCCERANRFDELQHNAIMDAYNKLLDEVYGLQVGE